MTLPVLEVHGIAKSYRAYHSQFQRFLSWAGRDVGFTDHWILQGVSFSVMPGESIGILGRNGAGKSTLLKMIAGTLAPTQGHVITRGKVNAILELGMGFNNEFTARENVFYACGLMGYDRASIEQALPAIETFADVGEYFDQPMRAFSNGMMVRVAFAAATAFRPDVLIVDEALSVGDLSFQAKCFERIAQLKASGTALLYVSHAVTDVVKHCERCLYVKDFGLAMDGASREVSNTYLDDLFGKGHGKSRAGGAKAASGALASTDLEDVFHQRPGYRRDEYRWGQGGARILDYCVEAEGAAFPTQIHTGQTVCVRYRVHFERGVERPVFGLLIKSHDGIYLYGTNSQLAEGTSDGRGAGGSFVTVAFEFVWQLNEGTHLLSLGVSEQHDEQALVPLDRRYDSVLLQTVNARQGSGMLDLAARFSLEGVLG